MVEITATDYASSIEQTAAARSRLLARNVIVAAMGFQPSAYELIIESACEVDNQLEGLGA